eukprot:GHVS01090651.1.p1 GENE.GHVS01090651.1~~GHVS01090651.1.p1  ORF type:complete len:771 (-),score=163.46 GHVS01090651.1:331-2409(-)
MAPEHVQAAVDQMLQEDRFLLVNGELISRAYLDRIAEEMNELLQTVGELSISELSQKYTLSASFLREQITTRLQSIINGNLVNQCYLQTSGFSRRIVACVRGALIGALLPLSLSDIATVFSLELSAVASAAADIIAAGGVGGRIRGDVFIPQSYAANRSCEVKEFYKANGYVSYAFARERGVDNIESFDSEGLRLSAMLVDPSLLAVVQANVQEAMSRRSWVDISPLVPASITTEDAESILHYALEKIKMPPSTSCSTTSSTLTSSPSSSICTATTSCCVALSSGFVDRLCDAMMPPLRAVAEQDQAVAVAGGAKGEVGGGRGGEAKGGLPKGGTGGTPIGTADGKLSDDERTGGGKKKGKTGNKKSKRGASSSSSPPPAPTSSSPSHLLVRQLVVDQCEGSRLLRSAVTEEEWDELSDEWRDRVLYEMVVPRLVCVYDAAVQERKRSTLLSGGGAKLLQDKWRRELESKFENIQLGAKALQQLLGGQEESNGVALTAYLFKSLVGEAVDMLLQLAYYHVFAEEVSSSAETRRPMIDKLIQADSSLSNLHRVYSCLSKRSLSTVVEDFGVCMTDVFLLNRKIDKKREKALLQENKTKWVNQLQTLTSSEPIDVFQASLSLAILQHLSLLLFFPAEPWALCGVWKLAAPKLPEAKSEQLARMAALIGQDHILDEEEARAAAANLLVTATTTSS